MRNYIVTAVKTSVKTFQTNSAIRQFQTRLYNFFNTADIAMNVIA